MAETNKPGLCVAILATGFQCRKKKEGERFCTAHLTHPPSYTVDGPLRFDACAGKTDEGFPCPLHPVVGVDLCISHGGRSKGIQKIAKLRQHVEKAEKALETFGLPIKGEIDPFQSLLEEIARTSGHILWLGDAIQQLDPEALIFGLAEVEEAKGDDAKNNYVIRKSAAVPHVWIELYQRERAHLVTVCKAAIGAGIADRQVKLAEQQGELIVKILNRTLGDPELGLTEEQLVASHKVAARHLRLAGEGA